jgi:hypothetical protein
MVRSFGLYIKRTGLNPADIRNNNRKKSKLGLLKNTKTKHTKKEKGKEKFSLRPTQANVLLWSYTTSKCSRQSSIKLIILTSQVFYETISIFAQTTAMSREEQLISPSIPGI